MSGYGNGRRGGRNGDYGPLDRPFEDKESGYNWLGINNLFWVLAVGAIAIAAVVISAGHIHDINNLEDSNKARDETIASQQETIDDLVENVANLTQRVEDLEGGMGGMSGPMLFSTVINSGTELPGEGEDLLRKRSVEDFVAPGPAHNFGPKGSFYNKKHAQVSHKFHAAAEANPELYHHYAKHANVHDHEARFNFGLGTGIFIEDLNNGTVVKVRRGSCDVAERRMTQPRQGPGGSSQIELTNQDVPTFLSTLNMLNDSFFTTTGQEEIPSIVDLVPQISELVPASSLEFNENACIQAGCHPTNPSNVGTDECLEIWGGVTCRLPARQIVAEGDETVCAANDCTFATFNPADPGNCLFPFGAVGPPICALIFETDALPIIGQQSGAPAPAITIPYTSKWTILAEVRVEPGDGLTPLNYTDADGTLECTLTAYAGDLADYDQNAFGQYRDVVASKSAQALSFGNQNRLTLALPTTLIEGGSAYGVQCLNTDPLPAKFEIIETTVLDTASDCQEKRRGRRRRGDDDDDDDKRSVDEFTAAIQAAARRGPAKDITPKRLYA